MKICTIKYSVIIRDNLEVKQVESLRSYFLLNCQERLHCRNDILCRELDDKEEPSVRNLQEEPSERRKI